MRYAAYDRPAFIINHALSKEVVTMYLAGLYRIDPLYEISRTNREPLVVNLRSMPTDHVPDEQYLAALFKSAFIFDELAVLLPTYGGVTIAICCERSQRRFTESEADILQAIQPLLYSIHKLHIDRVYSAAGKRATAERDGPEGAMLVLDDRNKPVYANAAWAACPHVANRLPEIVARLEEGRCSHILLGEGHIAHWERLPKDSSLAPNGSLLMLDRRSPGPLGDSARRAVESFCEAYALTPRETEVVRLSLIGAPNALIAKKLGVSVGTVKNHRWRLYYKLDITTERELFRLFISTLLSIESVAPSVDAAGKETKTAGFSPADWREPAAPARVSLGSTARPFRALNIQDPDGLRLASAPRAGSDADCARTDRP
jgi:DNA-binding CsgD family transcriptional regulator